MNIDDSYEEIRSAVRALCAQFPDEYFRKIDLERGYPEEFVRALTEAEHLFQAIGFNTMRSRRPPRRRRR